MRKILVIDDDRDIRNAICEFLDSVGCQTVAASNGAEGLNRLRQEDHPPALILLDWNMPVMSGAEFLRARDADSTARAIPVVVISAGLIGRDRLYGSQLITKPLDIDELTCLVQRYCA